MFRYDISVISTRGESRVAGESRKSCALGCGRALLWNALPVARAALGARWKDPTPELVKSWHCQLCQSLKKVISFIYHKGLGNTLSVAFYFFAGHLILDILFSKI